MSYKEIHPDLSIELPINGANCGDPRGMSSVPGVLHTHQFFGGVAGLGMAGGVALAADNDRFFNQFTTTGELGRGIANIAASRNYQILGHFGCAFINYATAIAEQARDIDFAVAALQASDPSQRADDIVPIARSFGKILDWGAVTEQVATINDLTNVNGPWAPVPLQTPDHDSHGSKTALLTDDPRLSLNARDACAAGRAVYHHNNAGTVLTVQEKIRTEMPINRHKFVLAGKLVAASTHAVLERETGHKIKVARVMPPRLHASEV